ncbi:component of SufBCD complex [Pseudooceanicola sp. CBS1P-1]|uniref:Component of SufBCD complex n=1 Tax=Pseudooceanicola albus TaxID=2692189 RepID=A0A6L7FYL2_9RHOB|nr:component of SufBCD complex [Pseudooceanicola endophyticus]MXN16390.1 component of SufBCD complex [Pseudooceanicola albus]
MILALLDLRSFSNLWFWIVLAGIWTFAGSLLVGVPHALAAEAQAEGSAAERDLHDLVRIRAIRAETLVERQGVWFAGLGTFLLTVLALLGFLYDVEFGQAAFLILFPLSLCWLMSLQSFRRMGRERPDTAGLLLRLRRLRVSIQAVGLIAVLATSAWGMYVNALHGILGR